MLTPNFAQTFPLLLDERAQGGVVGIRRVLLKAEGGGDEIDRHAEGLAEREHDGSGLRAW